MADPQGGLNLVGERALAQDVDHIDRNVRMALGKATNLSHRQGREGAQRAVFIENGGVGGQHPCEMLFGLKERQRCVRHGLPSEASLEWALFGANAPSISIDQTTQGAQMGDVANTKDTTVASMSSFRMRRRLLARPAPESPAAARKSGPEQHSIDMNAALTLPTAETTIFPNGTSQGTRI